MDDNSRNLPTSGPTADETALVHAFYQRILETLPVQLAVFSPDGRYEYVTPSAVDDPELRHWLVGKTDHEWAALTGLPAEVPTQRLHAIRSVAEDGSSSTFEETYVASDGAARAFRRYVVPVTDAHGTVQHVLGYGIDLTEQRRVEEQLRQSQKMEAVGRLAGGVAHDFNNLLTIIGGYTDVLQASIANDDPCAEAVASIREATERAAGLTKQLLAFSRRTPLSIGPIDAHAIIRDTVRLLDRVIGGHVEVTVSLCTESPWISADAGQFKQVLLNLVINARDAMPHGGRLSITTRRVHFDAAMPEPEHADDGSYLEVCVQDTGVGMTPETLSRLFEPFFTTKPPDKGTGLGLSIVYGIVTHMGGYVLADSAPNRGATFRTLMPVTAAGDSGRTHLDA